MSNHFLLVEFVSFADNILMHHGLYLLMRMTGTIVGYILSVLTVMNQLLRFKINEFTCMNIIKWWFVDFSTSDGINV